MLKDAHWERMMKNAESCTSEWREPRAIRIHSYQHRFVCKICSPRCIHVADSNDYSEPSEIVLQTTHRDVVLDYFKNKKELIFDLRSGVSLKIDDVYLSAELHGRDVRVAKFLKSFCRDDWKAQKQRLCSYIVVGAFHRSMEGRGRWSGNSNPFSPPFIFKNITKCSRSHKYDYLCDLVFTKNLC